MIGETALNQDFEALLDYLRRTHGFDFGGYKRSSLMRRVERRMQQLDGIATFDHYLDFLQVHPEEFTALFNTILINVTAFFRDTAAWDHLSAVAIPRLLAGRAEDDEIRVWSAGCASGEEAYSLAMVLADALGVDAFRRRVKIYATTSTTRRWRGPARARTPPRRSPVCPTSASSATSSPREAASYSGRSCAAPSSSAAMT